MINILLVATAATSFTYYPEFVDTKARVEAVKDLGPVLEVIVKCRKGSAIMSFSKMERVFCASDWKCYRDLDTAMAKSCN